MVLTKIFSEQWYIVSKNFWGVFKLVINEIRCKMLFCLVYTVFIKNTSFRKVGFSQANYNGFWKFKSLFVTFFYRDYNDCIYSLQKLNSDTLILDRTSLTYSVTDCFTPNLSRTFWNSLRYLWKSVPFGKSEGK